MEAAALVFVLAVVAAHGQSFGLRGGRTQFRRAGAQLGPPVDAIFRPRSQLRPKKEELDKQEELLSQQIVAGADEALVTRQVDKVEAIRSHMNKMRTLMLLKERQILSPEQRVKLNKLHEQWERDHKRERDVK